MTTDFSNLQLFFICITYPIFQAYLITQNLDPNFRMQSVERFFKRRNEHSPIVESVRGEFHSNSACISKGMDQGIHNWLLYSGDLKYFFGKAPTIFKQGEGYVSSLGIA